MVAYPASIINGIFTNLRSATMASIGLGVKAEEEGQKPQETEISTYLLAVVSGFLYQLIVWIGLILFIIPGIYWSIKYMFYYFYIVDEDRGPIEALSESGDLTDGYKWKLLLLSILVSLFNLLGVLLLGVGTLVTGPISTMVMLSAYRQLKKIQQEEMELYVPGTKMEPLTPLQVEPVVVNVTDVEILEEY